jgi:hypothetical protein
MPERSSIQRFESPQSRLLLQPLYRVDSLVNYDRFSVCCILHLIGIYEEDFVSLLLVEAIIYASTMAPASQKSPFPVPFAGQAHTIIVHFVSGSNDSPHPHPGFSIEPIKGNCHHARGCLKITKNSFQFATILCYRGVINTPYGTHNILFTTSLFFELHT